MNILAIESSADDTAIAIVTAQGKDDDLRFCVLADGVSTQTIHAGYGGIFPAMAKREHARNIVPLLEQVTDKITNFAKDTANNVQNETISPEIINKVKEILNREEGLSEVLFEYLNRTNQNLAPKINFEMIAVTFGPGLEPALWVGLNMAKALSLIWQIPLMPVNHMEGHLLSSIFDRTASDGQTRRIIFPAIGLLVSGGHTEIIHWSDWYKYKIIGRTKDDAAGEAFDKVARILGLPYPGGPEISRLAQSARKNSVESTENKTDIILPRPMLHSKDYDFSFSGLKTAVLYLVKRLAKINFNDNTNPEPASLLTAEIKAEIAREFEDAAIEVLVKKTFSAIQEYNAKTLLVGGGVAANTLLRNQISLKKSEEFPDLRVYFPDSGLSGDNAIMIALAAYMNFLNKNSVNNLDSEKDAGVNPAPTSGIVAEGNLKLGAL